MSDALGRLDAFVLAGGLGTRLRAVVPDQQKILAPVAGVPSSPGCCISSLRPGSAAPCWGSGTARRRCAGPWAAPMAR